MIDIPWRCVQSGDPFGSLGSFWDITSTNRGNVILIKTPLKAFQLSKLLYLWSFYYAYGPFAFLVYQCLRELQRTHRGLVELVNRKRYLTWPEKFFCTLILHIINLRKMQTKFGFFYPSHCSTALKLFFPLIRLMSKREAVGRTKTRIASFHSWEKKKL